MIRWLLLFLSLSFSVSAETYPIVVPAGVGGPTDTIARRLQKQLSEKHIETIVVNKSGLSGNLGFDYFIKDCKSCLLIATEAIYTNKIYFPESYPEDIVKDAIKLAKLGKNSTIVLTSLPINNLKDLIELSKNKTITVGNGGIGTTSYRAYKELCNIMNNNCIEVRYKSFSSSLPDLFSKTLDVYVFLEVGTLNGIVVEGLTKAIATLDNKRFQNIPTASEQGFDLVITGEYNLYYKNIPEFSLAIIRKTVLENKY